MSTGNKKISFSFSKVKKPSLEIELHKECTDKVEFVDCYDGAKGEFTYLGKSSDKDVKKEKLVIPLLNSKSHHNVWTNFENKVHLKAAHRVDENKTTSSHDLMIHKFHDSIKKKPESQIPIDEIAAAEILSDFKSDHQIKNSKKLIISESMPISSNCVENIIDYEQVPVSDFGMAMLRGMGWNPDCGIGKEPSLVPTFSPKLRPKGLGLGAKYNLKSSQKKSH